MNLAYPLGGLLGFLLGVPVGWALASVLPAHTSKEVATMRHRIWTWVQQHTVSIVVFTVVICCALVPVTGYLFAHKDDFQHCVNGWIKASAPGQPFRAKANAALQKAQRAVNLDPSDTTRAEYREAYRNFVATLAKYPIPPIPPCLTK